MKIRYDVRMGWLERGAMFGGGVILLAGTFWFFRPGDFLVYFFLWPAAVLALWTMGYAVFGHDEAWRFEDGQVVRRQRNCVGTTQSSWSYGDVAEMRVRAAGISKGDGHRVELLIGDRWLNLPAQRERDAAERMLAEIAGHKSNS